MLFYPFLRETNRGGTIQGKEEMLPLLDGNIVIEINGIDLLLVVQQLHKEEINIFSELVQRSGLFFNIASHRSLKNN